MEFVEHVIIHCQRRVTWIIRPVVSARMGTISPAVARWGSHHGEPWVIRGGGRGNVRCAKKKNKQVRQVRVRVLPRTSTKTGMKKRRTEIWENSQVRQRNNPILMVRK
uniref:Uncharacterized protein n=1 Tax=Cacopsylla melanoneura TaxID=428564 RepID=A0A8D8TC26_9HEMI